MDGFEQRPGSGSRVPDASHGATSSSGPGKRTLTEALPAVPQSHGTVTPVQRKADGAPQGDVAAAAQQGVSGSPQALPHGDRIQQSFEHHDVSGVQAHVGGPAAAASKQIGASAYAT